MSRCQFGSNLLFEAAAEEHWAVQSRASFAPRFHVLATSSFAFRDGIPIVHVPRSGGAMISGAHFIIYSSDVEKDREFLKDLLKLTHVDVGRGWLIFGLPPSEVAVHPGSNSNELYFMCDDIAAFRREMQEKGIEVKEPSDEGWGLLSQLALPGGGTLGVYQPRHARPEPM